MNEDFKRVLNIIEQKGSLDVDIKIEYLEMEAGLKSLSYTIWVTLRIYYNETTTKNTVGLFDKIAEAKQELIIEAYNICKAGMLSEE